MSEFIEEGVEWQLGELSGEVVEKINKSDMQVLTPVDCEHVYEIDDSEELGEARVCVKCRRGYIVRI